MGDPQEATQPRHTSKKAHDSKGKHNAQQIRALKRAWHDEFPTLQPHQKTQARVTFSLKAQERRRRNRALAHLKQKLCKPALAGIEDVVDGRTHMGMGSAPFPIAP